MPDEPSDSSAENSNAELDCADADALPAAPRAVAESAGEVSTLRRFAGLRALGLLTERRRDDEAAVEDGGVDTAAAEGAFDSGSELAESERSSVLLALPYFFIYRWAISKLDMFKRVGD